MSEPKSSAITATFRRCRQELVLFNLCNHRCVCRRNTEADIPLDRQKCRLLSKFKWLTVCISHCLSHFAAFFIDMRAKTSTVEGFTSNIITLVRYARQNWLSLGMYEYKIDPSDVHLRKPCYDFSFLKVVRFTLILRLLISQMKFTRSLDIGRSDRQSVQRTDL